MGPVMEFAHYKNFIEFKGEYKDIPSTFAFTMKIFGQVLMWGAVHLTLTVYVPFHFVTTPEFMEYNFIYKIMYMNLAMDSVKARYYLAFKFTEAGTIATGFSYEGMVTKNGKLEPSFDRTAMMITTRTELGTTPKEMIEGWNV